MDQSNSKNILRAWKNSERSQEQSNPINDSVIFPVFLFSFLFISESQNFQ